MGAFRLPARPLAALSMARRSTLDTVFSARCAALSSALPLALSGDRTGVHQARVASRRLREVLPVLEIGRPRLARDANRAVRQVTRALGAVREFDVSHDVAEALLAAHPVRAGAASSLRRALVAHRAEAMQTARARLSEARLARLWERLAAVDEARGHATRPAVASAAARVARRAGQARRLIAALGVLYEPDHLHAIRIALKRWRYALEVFTELRRARPPAMLGELRRMQDALGKAHDLHVLGVLIRAVEAAVVTKSRPAARDLGRLVDAIDAACRHEHGLFLSRREALLAAARRRPVRARTAA